MDMKRFLPLAAIAVIAYMLLLEWQDFKTQHNQTAQVSQAAGLPAQANDNSTIPAVASLTNEEIPSVATPQVQTMAPKSEQLISITTDVLDIKISPAGGDIVHVGLLKHLKSLEGEPQAFTLLQQSADHNYVAQSGLVGANGTDAAGKRPLFSVEKHDYQLKDGEDKLVVDLHLTQENGVKITKRYTLHRDNYLVDIDYLINNQTTETWSANFYAQLKRDNAQDPSAQDGGALGIQPFLGVATSTDDERFMKIAFQDIKDEKFSADKQGGWIAMIQHYFLTAWIPEEQGTYNYSTLVTRSGDNLARVMGPSVQVAAGQTGTISSHFYAGPKDQYKLEKIAEGLDLSVDYGFLWMIAQPLYALMYGFSTGEYHFFGMQFDIGAGFHNWGFAIIALTILIKALFFYPSAISYRSMAKMRKLGPKLASLKELYPDDRQKQSQEMMNLYKKEGVNPVGGCLPILIQMPVFIALYWVLLESVELRHAPFIGYINDLSSMDPYFFLPLVMGASMYIQQKLNPPPPDPMQAKILQWMPVFFTVFFLWFPAGLVLYWVVNNILSIAQQYIITKRIEAEG